MRTFSKFCKVISCQWHIKQSTQIALPPPPLPHQIQIIPLLLINTSLLGYKYKLQIHRITNTDTLQVVYDFVEIIGRNIRIQERLPDRILEEELRAFVGNGRIIRN